MTSHFPLVLGSRMVELYLHSPIRLRCLVGEGNCLSSDSQNELSLLSSICLRELGFLVWKSIVYCEVRTELSW
jgi:hypothetical protein